MQKVCFFISSISGKGGTERVCSEIANSLVQQGKDVTIVSLFEGLIPTYSLDERIHLIQLFRQKQSFLKNYFKVVRRLNKIIKETRFTHFIVADTILCVFAAPVLFGKKTKHIAWEHFNYTATFGLMSRKVSRWVAAYFADRIVVLTERDILLWNEKLKCRHKMVCIPNPMLLGDVNIMPYSEREQLIIAAGRLTYQKGYDLLIRAWSLVADKFQDWRLIILGSGEDEQLLREMISKQVPDGRLQLITYSERIFDYYNKASLFCLSSRFEGLPMVLIEALAFRLPIVSFNCNTGPEEIVEHGKNGLLCEPENVEQFSAAIEEVLKSEQLRIKFSNYTQHMITKFEKSVVMKKWEELLTE